MVTKDLWCSGCREVRPHEVHIDSRRRPTAYVCQTCGMRWAVQRVPVRAAANGGMQHGTLRARRAGGS